MQTTLPHPPDLTELRTEGKIAADKGLRIGWYCIEAADEIERLQKFANSFGLCACAEGMCDPIHDFQCRAREALTGVPNVKRVHQET